MPTRDQSLEKPTLDDSLEKVQPEADTRRVVGSRVQGFDAPTAV
jgi:hypothetical protein